MISLTTLISANSSATSSFVRATSTTMFLIGAFRGAPRMMVALALAARRSPEAGGKLFRTMRITAPVIGCKHKHHPHNISSLLTNVRLRSHTRQAQQAAPGVVGQPRRRGEGELW